MCLRCLWPSPPPWIALVRAPLTMGHDQTRAGAPEIFISKGPHSLNKPRALPSPAFAGAVTARDPPQSPHKPVCTHKRRERPKMLCLPHAKVGCWIALQKAGGALQRGCLEGRGAARGEAPQGARLTPDHSAFTQCWNTQCTPVACQLHASCTHIALMCAAGAAAWQPDARVEPTEERCPCRANVRSRVLCLCSWTPPPRRMCGDRRPAVQQLTSCRHCVCPWRWGPCGCGC